MIEFIKNWAVAITIAVLIGTILETLLPDSNIKKYVKFAIGVAVMLIIVMPFLNLFTGKTDIKAELSDLFKNVQTQSDTYKENDLSSYKDYVYEVYMRDKNNKNE